MNVKSFNTPQKSNSATGSASRPGYAVLHLLLTAVSADLLLLTVNRRTDLTLSFAAPNEFLRWTEVNNMLLGLVTVLLYYALNSHVGARPGGERRDSRALGLIFTFGVYLYAMSYGSHEITNYLNSRFCFDGSGSFCSIVDFNDNEFSHYLFFGGFIILNVTVMFTQFLSPATRPISHLDNLLIAANALVIAAGIAANLAFERIGADLYVVAAVAIMTVVMSRRLPGQPILRYYAIAYVGGFSLAVAIIMTR
ncbi:hypothetical protein ACFYWY_37940 [Streptomyces sp. NPDC002870]|uniref:hypothetical protein n=1 Tax=Streptomyces sp. NPDC002870 TaxID=3364666 RepID=UPI0036AB604F